MDAISSGDVVKAVGHLMMVAVGVVLPWLTAGSTTGSALTALFSILGGICALVFSLMYRRYLGILGAGAKRKGTPERKAFYALRESLAGDNLAARLYADWLKRFLDAVERFFGDAGTVGQRAFGLQKPAPLWTATAFDRCLLLALIYPIVTVFGIWAVSGHIGPAETALGLKPDIPAWSRSLPAAAMGFSGFAIWRCFLTMGSKQIVWALSAAVAAFASIGASAFAGAVDAAYEVGGNRAGMVAIASAFTGADAFTGAGTVALGVALGVAVTVAYVIAGVVAVMVLSAAALKHRRKGVFFASFSLR